MSALNTIKYSFFFAIICVRLSTVASNYLSKVPKSCHGLFQHGVYDNRSIPARWIPDGCELKHYTTEETIHCLKNAATSHGAQRKNIPAVTFIGDSRVRQLRDEFFSHLTGRQIDWLSNKSIKIDPTIYSDKHEDTTFHLDSVTIELLFGRDIDTTVEKVQRLVRRITNRQEFPDVIVIGNAVWTMLFCVERKISKKKCLNNYERGAKLLFDSLAHLEKKVPILWVPHGYIGEPRKKTNIYDKVNGYKLAESYNNVIRTILRNVSDRGVTYWNSFDLAFHQMNDSLDRLHVGPISKGLYNQMLINFLCNSRLSAAHPVGLCCAKEVAPELANSVSINFRLQCAVYFALLGFFFRWIFKRFGTAGI